MSIVFDDIKNLPLDVIREISNFHPLLIPPFTNDRLRRAVMDYLVGGARKQDIVKKYGEISGWNVSKVTDMNELFADATAFNQPLNDWDVSNVTEMSEMFESATSFNQPLTGVASYTRQ